MADILIDIVVKGNQDVVKATKSTKSLQSNVKLLSDAFQKQTLSQRQYYKGIKQLAEATGRSEKELRNLATTMRKVEKQEREAKAAAKQYAQARREAEEANRRYDAEQKKSAITAAKAARENKKVADLHSDLNQLLGKWDNATKTLKTAKAPQKIISELDRATAILRDLLNETFNHIHTNSQDIYDDSRSYLQTIAPEKVEIVKLYKGKAPIFEHFGIDKQIKNSFGKIVTIRSGIYLIIEHTEALHVIDVNSGHRVNKKNNQEQNALEVNLEAAEEIARQLRLRDMGGIIVVDFIDMHQGANRRKLYEHLKQVMEKDTAKHTILPPSKFGLVQITRQRVRPEMDIQVLEKCPVCKGSGEARSSILLIDDIEKNLRYLIQDQNESKLTLMVHPYIHAYLKRGLKSIQIKWYLQFKQWVRLVPMPSYHFLEYRFFNKNDDEIKM